MSYKKPTLLIAAISLFTWSGAAGMAPAHLSSISSSQQEQGRSVPVSSPDPKRIQERLRPEGTTDLSAMWSDLGLSSELDTVWDRVGALWDDEPARFSECNECEAELFEVELNGEPGPESVLKIYEPYGRSRYLIFSAETSERRWRLLGHADHDFARYYTPEHSVETLGGRPYLVLRVQGISGTGVSQAFDRWYEVGDRVTEVLSLPAKGHQCADGLSLCREWESRVIGRETEGGKDTVRVLFRIAYSGSRFLIDGAGEEAVDILETESTVYYSRASAGSPFVVDLDRSEMSQRDLRMVFNIDALGDEDFLRIHRRDLERVIPGSGDETKAWLRRFLHRCADVPERVALLRLVGG